MTYQILALKWRPKNFTEIQGQQATLRSLQNSLSHGAVQNCYLFTGTRGVGKTTLARVLAKSINCVQGISANPCGVCHICAGITAGNCPDVIEIDAASKTKVDDTRELLDNISYAPIHGKFKIYIIDEVHMLSTHSFNALLKTMEEPPAHVKFILATTEPSKIPNTILSRCSQYHLKEFTPQEIINQLTNILTQENITSENRALAYIAQLANGSMRDALTLCEQVICYDTRSLPYASCEQTFGVALEDKLIELMLLISVPDNLKALTYVNNLLAQNIDINNVLKKLQSLIFNISLYKLEPSMVTHWPTDKLAALASNINTRDLQVFYQAAVNGARDLAFSPDQQIALRMIILRMLSFQSVKASSTSNAPSMPISKPVVISNTAPTISFAPPPIIATPTLAKANPAMSAAMPLASMPAATHGIAADAMVWGEVVAKLELKGLTKVISENCVLDSFNDNLCELHLDTNYKPLLNDKIIASVAQALSLHYNKSIQVKITLQEVTTATPAMQKKQLLDDAQQAAKQQLLTNVNIVALQQILDAKVEGIHIIEDSATR
jgi:DNA polymerase-3 subunit gamma/tau